MKSQFAIVCLLLATLPACNKTGGEAPSGATNLVPRQPATTQEKTVRSTAAGGTKPEITVTIAGAGSREKVIRAHVEKILTLRGILVVPISSGSAMKGTVLQIALKGNEVETCEVTMNLDADMSADQTAAATKGNTAGLAAVGEVNRYLATLRKSEH